MLQETKIQINCKNWFRYRYSKYSRMLFHVPNEGTGNSRRGALMKAMGVERGVPDLMLLVPRNGFHGLGIEVKDATGRQSKEQKEYRDLMTEHGYDYKVIRSLEDFISVCHEYLGPEIDPDLETLKKILNNA